LHSYANPKHEQALAKKIKQQWPEFEIVTSSELTREWREYERTNTTALCAYVKPIAKNYLDNLFTELKKFKFQGNPYVMQSNGGIDTFESTKKTPLTIIESGPTSGVLGAAEIGKLIGVKDIIALDIGGVVSDFALEIFLAFLVFSSISK